MKTPKPTKLADGTYDIRLRLRTKNDEQIAYHVKDTNKAACILKATEIKAYWKLHMSLPSGNGSVSSGESETLFEAMQSYYDSIHNVISPSTARGYHAILSGGWKEFRSVRYKKLTEQEWQKIVNDEAATCAPKTLKNRWYFLRDALIFAKYTPPKVKLARVQKPDPHFLPPEYLRDFVNVVKNDECAIPLLLALSSMRMSEIDGLDWNCVAKDGSTVSIRRVRVKGVNGLVYKTYAKNDTSRRNVLIHIPALKQLLADNWKESGKVMLQGQRKVRTRLKEICINNNFPIVTPHQLRHSFASLCYYLRIPLLTTMQQGGWKDREVLEKVYTHLTEEDAMRFEEDMTNFYDTGKKKNFTIKRLDRLTGVSRETKLR